MEYWMNFESQGAFRVLIADDSKEVTSVLGALLEGLGGIELLPPVYDGAEAIKRICELRPDLLVLDLKMPVLTGLDVLREMRQEGIRPIVIVLTGYSESDYARPCKVLGANYFVTKPNFDRVIELVKQLQNEWLVPHQMGYGLRSYPGGARTNIVWLISAEFVARVCSGAFPTGVLAPFSFSWLCCYRGLKTPFQAEIRKEMLKGLKGNSTQRAVILIAEDRAKKILLIRRAFARGLMRSRLQMVRNGEEILAYLDGDGKYANREEYPKPNLLFLNANLPRMDGFEVLKLIRQRSLYKELPVFLLSTSEDVRDAHVAQELDANSFLVKTMTLENLLELTGFINRSWLTLNKMPRNRMTLRGVQPSRRQLLGQQRRRPGGNFYLGRRGWRPRRLESVGTGLLMAASAW
jgi:CheY-like chemotaxis protein